MYAKITREKYQAFLPKRGRKQDLYDLKILPKIRIIKNVLLKRKIYATT